MAEKIYPGGGRENDFSSMYCQMAMQSYYRAFQYYEEIRQADFSWSKCDEYHELQKAVISTVVFSAMSLEAYFNNYIAACLGDKEYYDSFDNLTPEGKFQLIIKFIFRTKIDKSKACYGGLVNLFKLRNRYIHNKSKRSKFQGYTLEEYIEHEKMFLDEDIIFPDPPLLDHEEINRDMRDAREAIKAVYNVALYFEEHDENCLAVLWLFGGKLHPAVSPYEIKAREFVYQKLGIKGR